MNCHGNNKNSANEKGNGHKGHLPHMLMMALCCGIPVIIILLVPLIGSIVSPGISKVLLGIAPFLCPLMMILMMPMMFKSNKDKDKNSDCHQNKQMLPGEKTYEE